MKSVDYNKTVYKVRIPDVAELTEEVSGIKICGDYQMREDLISGSPRLTITVEGKFPYSYDKRYSMDAALNVLNWSMIRPGINEDVYKTVSIEYIFGGSPVERVFEKMFPCSYLEWNDRDGGHFKLVMKQAVEKNYRSTVSSADPSAHRAKRRPLPLDSDIKYDITIYTRMFGIRNASTKEGEWKNKNSNELEEIERKILQEGYEETQRAVIVEGQCIAISYYRDSVEIVVNSDGKTLPGYPTRNWAVLIPTSKTEHTTYIRGEKAVLLLSDIIKAEGDDDNSRKNSLAARMNDELKKTLGYNEYVAVRELFEMAAVKPISNIHWDGEAKIVTIDCLTTPVLINASEDKDFLFSSNEYAVLIGDLTYVWADKVAEFLDKIGISPPHALPNETIIGGSKFVGLRALLDLHYGEAGYEIDWDQPAKTATIDVRKKGVVLYNPKGKLPSGGGVRATPFKTNAVGSRSPEAYREVIESFNVETTSRYKAKDGKTYCNIFAWDVTCAMNAEIPHIVDSNREKPLESVNETGANYQRANNMYDWLAKYGSNYEWRRVTQDEAVKRANQGYPTVVIWKNSDAEKPGHIAMVAPQKPGDTAVKTAQAGSKNYNYGGLSTSFSKSGTMYYTHD